MTENQTGIYIQMKIDMHAKKMSKQCLKQEKNYFKCKQFINCFYTPYALLRDASFLIGSL